MVATSLASLRTATVLLGYFLHPRHAEDMRTLITTKRILWTRISDFVVYYYRWLIGKDFGFIRDDANMWLEDPEYFTNVGKSFLNPVDFWRHVKTEGHATKLPDLAIVVLSIAVNTATCERLYSELGAIHSPNRNRLNPKKTLQIHHVRKHVRDQLPSDRNGNPRLL